jgi:hypothetical protein
VAGEDRQGAGFHFSERRAATPEAASAEVDALRAELEAKGVPVKEGSWGYQLLVVDDPDGNQLFFNYPAATASTVAVRTTITDRTGWPERLPLPGSHKT